MILKQEEDKIIRKHENLDKIKFPFLEFRIKKDDSERIT